MKPSVLLQQATDAFHLYADKGRKALDNISPVLSHVCFKFTDTKAYQTYVEAACELGLVTQEQFNGKEISWCKLQQPLSKDDLVLEWLEMVEPKVETNAFNGVTSLGYYAADLSQTIKLPTADENIIYRYQSQQAHP